MSRQQYTPRSKTDTARFFDGLELIEPGLVPIQDSRLALGEQPAVLTGLSLGG